MIHSAQKKSVLSSVSQLTSELLIRKLHDIFQTPFKQCLKSSWFCLLDLPIDYVKVGLCHRGCIEHLVCATSRWFIESSRIDHLWIKWKLRLGPTSAAHHRITFYLPWNLCIKKIIAHIFGWSLLASTYNVKNNHTIKLIIKDAWRVYACLVCVCLCMSVSGVL